MKRLRIEIQVTLLSLVIAIVVVALGYLGYRSLSQIVDKIHEAAQPDNRLFLIKDITSDLNEIENNVRLYVLTNEKQNKDYYKVLYNSVNEKIQLLSEENVPANEIILNDSIVSLSFEKLGIWEGVLQLHESTKGIEPAFSEMYSKLETQKIDTTYVKKEKKGFFRKIFGTTKIEVDTTVFERDLKKDEIKEEIKSLHSQILQKGQQFNILESQLIERNLAVSEQINSLIQEIEKNESDKLAAKTSEADRLAALSYKRLLAFSITAMLLLFLVLYLLYDYVLKSRKYEKALQIAKEEAEKFAQAKEQFAANVSHELRTPVNVIYGLAEQLLQKEMNKQTKEQVIVLSKSAQHLKNIVNDTLDFSKIQSNKLNLHSVHFSPSDVFKEIISLLRSEAVKKKLELKYETKGELPQALIGDPLRLKQILLNLINNSLKFTETGYILLLVETITINEEEFLIKMIIEDSGIGITPEDQDIIFEEFVQADNSGTKEHKGTGLGLSIVKKLIELQNGQILMESELGKGTKIIVEIPYKKGNPEEIDKQVPIHLDIPASFKNLSVLVADDEEFNRFLIKGIFEKWGVHYHEVSNGTEAIEFCSQNNVDFVLMDLNMPGLNGIEATKAILKENQNRKIIAITASSKKPDIKKCFDVGMIGYILKPFSEVELFDVINENLNQKTKVGKKPRLEHKIEIDLAELKRMSNNDEKFFTEMIEIFIRSAKTGLETITKDFDALNYEGVAEAAHKLAAPCKHIKSKKLHTLLVELENNVEKKKNNKEISQLINSISEEVEKTISYLQEYLKINS